MQGKAEVESSVLWKQAFSDEGTNANVSRLVTSLRSIRSNAEQLTSKIAGSLPGLTIHNIAHLDALWDVADIIAGPQFPLNPLEAYIFGAAVLFHDAGLCFEAYSGGRDGVRGTLEWRDAYSRLEGTHANGHEIELEADFEALRALHARQAAKLATEPWRDQEGKEVVYLIDDRELRGNYGQLIGEIASSHHWNLEQVVQQFSKPRPAAAFLERDWVIDPLKIACMLRTADAGHMDGARAPSFLLKTLQMNSVSRTHWTAQNRIGQLIINPDDPSQLTIASTSPFPRNEAGAWWVAFDLVAIFDKELRGCNDILNVSPSGQRTAFARKSVTGAGQVRELAKHIKTQDWEPTDSTVHVSDVSALITKLGGEQLYGRDADRLNVALRELIQNATDAISARRLFEPGFEGRITVRLTRQKNGIWVLQVDDDGIGMSQATLSTDLLDFGKSFWVSERAAQEFPGIHASGYSPIGHFGIGFFAIFMAARKVNVFSRRFDKGLKYVKCLSFENGISLRPILSADRPSDFGMNACTRVELELKPGVIKDPNQIEIRCNVMGHENFHVTFKDYVAAMIAGINVPVFVEWEGKSVKVHEKFPPETAQREQWLRSLSYLAASVNEKAEVGLARAITRLRPIRDGDKCYGLAAIDVLGGAGGGPFLSGKAVGGLVPPHGRYDEFFIGLINHLPATARRDAGEMAAPRHSFDAWLLEQVALLKQEGISGVESIFASYSICQLGYDPKSILQGILVASPGQANLWPLCEIATKLQHGLRIGFPISNMIGHLDTFSGRVEIPGIWTSIVVRNGKFNEARLLHGVPKEMNSLIGIVHRVLMESGHKPKWTIIESAYHGSIGRGDILEVTI